MYYTAACVEEAWRCCSRHIACLSTQDGNSRHMCAQFASSNCDKGSFFFFVLWFLWEREICGFGSGLSICSLICFRRVCARLLMYTMMLMKLSGWLLWWAVITFQRISQQSFEVYTPGNNTGAHDEKYGKHHIRFVLLIDWQLVAGYIV